jgi:hypothetical protein
VTGIQGCWEVDYKRGLKGGISNGRIANSERYRELYVLVGLTIKEVREPAGPSRISKEVLVFGSEDRSGGAR